VRHVSNPEAPSAGARKAEARYAVVVSVRAAAYVPNRATAAVDPTKGSSAT
jgi:hypothetical protein